MKYSRPMFNTKHKIGLGLLAAIVTFLAGCVIIAAAIIADFGKPTTTNLYLPPSAITVFLMSPRSSHYHVKYTEMPMDDIQAWKDAGGFDPAKKKTVILVHGFGSTGRDSWTSRMLRDFYIANCKKLLKWKFKLKFFFCLR